MLTKFAVTVYDNDRDTEVDCILEVQRTDADEISLSLRRVPLAALRETATADPDAPDTFMTCTTAELVAKALSFLAVQPWDK